MTRIATFNVNGVNGRLPVLLKWLAETDYDIVCPAGAEDFGREVPRRGIRRRASARSGTARILQRCGNLARGKEPAERRRGLPGDPDDTHSRYIEAEVDGLVIGCLYLPNGNPAPGPKFDYKLRWFDRLISYGQLLLKDGVATVLSGDYNVVPTPIDAVVPSRWLGDAVSSPRAGRPMREMLDGGWIDAVRRIHPEKGIYTYWNFSYRGGYDRSSGLRMDHLLVSPSLSDRLRNAGVDVEFGDGRSQATMRRPGSSSIEPRGTHAHEPDCLEMNPPIEQIALYVTAGYNVVVETPRGSRTKFAYDRETGLFLAKKLLPALCAKTPMPLERLSWAIVSHVNEHSHASCSDPTAPCRQLRTPVPGTGI